MHTLWAALLFCLPPLTWIATGLLAGWIAARRGKSWRMGFALGFCFSMGGVALAALPRRSSPARCRQPEHPGLGQVDAGRTDGSATPTSALWTT